MNFYDTGTVELYDLSKDISERNNLAEQNKVLTDELLNKLHHWRIEVNATMPTKNPCARLVNNNRIVFMIKKLLNFYKNFFSAS